MQHVEKIMSRYVTCHKAKMHGNNAGLYTTLLVPTPPWEDVSMILLWDCQKHKEVKIQFSW